MNKSVEIVLFLVSTLCYALLAYFVPRSNFTLTVSYLSVNFLAYVFYYIKAEEINVKHIVLVAILFRLITVFALPALSDDYFRFVWDGLLTYNEFNPYEYTPTQAIEQGVLPNRELYELLNSKDYFSVYPAINQFIYFLGVSVSPTSYYGATVVMKMIMLGAEIGTILLLINLLQSFRLPTKSIVLYALNPLVIMEFCGNLHFEGFMIFFMLLAFWLTMRQRLVVGAIAFATAICIKIIPVLFLPLFLKKLGFQKTVVFSVLTLVACLFFFLPFYNETTFPHILESIRLYIGGNFEFNSSFHRLMQLGEWEKHEIIKFLPKVVLVSSYLWIWWKIDTKHWHSYAYSFMLTYSIYLFFSQSVHPWYILPAVAFSMLTSFRFSMLWSYMACFTYITYLDEGNYSQNPWVILIEYIVVFALFGYEFWRYLINSKRIDLG